MRQTSLFRAKMGLLVLPLLLALGVPPAQADEAATRALAKQHNEAAKRLFNLGKFPEAAAEYEKAYKVLPLPAFLYNLGQCHARMDGVKNLERAKFFFEGYLGNQPNAPNRKEVEQELDDIKRKLKTLRTFHKPMLLMPTAVDSQRAALPPPTPWYKSWWFWTVVSVAVAGAAAGTVIALQPEDPQPIQGSLWPKLIELD